MITLMESILQQAYNWLFIQVFLVKCKIYDAEQNWMFFHWLAITFTSGEES